MTDTIKTGTILIKEGTLLPEALRLETESFLNGWTLVKNLDGYGLEAIPLITMQATSP